MWLSFNHPAGLSSKRRGAESVLEVGVSCHVTEDVLANPRNVLDLPRVDFAEVMFSSFADAPVFLFAEDSDARLARQPIPVG
jgi:hypothetical protein